MNIIQQATKKLIGSHPFYGFFLLGLKRQESTKFPSYGAVALNKQDLSITLILNPDLMNTLTIDEGKFLLAHEVSHLTRNHLFSNYKMPDSELSNISCDFSINSDLVSEGFVRPKQGMFPEDYELPPNKSSQWYYNKLSEMKEKMEQDENEGENGDSEEGEGESSGQTSAQGQGKPFDEQTPKKRLKDLLNSLKSKENPGTHHWEKITENLTDIEKEMLKERIINQITATANEIIKSSSKGDLPGYIKELLGNLEKFKIPAADWKKLLKRGLSSHPDITKKSTRKRRSKRFKDAPGFRKNKKTKILYAVDTSGSMSQKDLAEAFSEVNHVWKAGAEIDICEIDTQLNNIYPYKGKLPKSISGRGGTYLTPAIQYFNQHIHDYSMLLILTDGFHERPHIPSPKPIIHLVTTNGADKEEFDDLPYITIKMKNE